MQQWRKLHLKVWDSPQVMKLPLQARLLYFHMISVADDHGRFIADGAVLRKAFIYDDYSSEQVAGWREIIERAGLIKIYEKEGELYAFHPNWKEYQGGRGTPIRPDRKKSILPTPNQQTANDLPTDCQPNANEVQTQNRIEENRREEKRLISAKADDYKKLSDQIAYELEKTFKTVKRDRWPKMSFLMLRVKEKGRDAVVAALGNLRESKNFHEIEDYHAYLSSMIK